MSAFIPLAEVRREQFDWGVIGWRLIPAQGAKHLVVMDVELQPGGGHDFHRHPGQEEMIIVKQGTIVQFVEGGVGAPHCGRLGLRPRGRRARLFQRRGGDGVPASRHLALAGRRDRLWA